jgi:hypothetical protein
MGVMPAGFLLFCAAIHSSACRRSARPRSSCCNAAIRRLAAATYKLLVGHPLAHHVSMKIWIPGAGLIQKRRAHGRLLQLDLVEDGPHAPLPVGHVTHRPESSQGLLPRSTKADIVKWISTRRVAMEDTRLVSFLTADGPLQAVS